MPGPHASRTLITISSGCWKDARGKACADDAVANTTATIASLIIEVLLGCSYVRGRRPSWRACRRVRRRRRAAHSLRPAAELGDAGHARWRVVTESTSPKDHARTRTAATPSATRKPMMKLRSVIATGEHGGTRGGYCPKGWQDDPSGECRTTGATNGRIVRLPHHRDQISSR